MSRPCDHVEEPATRYFTWQPVAELAPGFDQYRPTASYVGTARVPVESSAWAMAGVNAPTRARLAKTASARVVLEILGTTDFSYKTVWTRRYEQDACQSRLSSFIQRVMDSLRMVRTAGRRRFPR